MSGLKAVVLEKKGSMLTVLSADGSFKKVRHQGRAEIGEEIEISTARPMPSWRIGVSVAAIFLMVFMGVFGWNAFQPGTAVAMISVDINPSLQITLDSKGRVLEMESRNPDAEQILSGLPLKGEPWKEAIEQIIEQSAKLHYLNSEQTWVIIGYSPITAESDLSKTDIDPTKIAERVEGTAEKNGISPQIAVYELTAKEHAKAQESGLTLGEYALMNTAQKVGIQVEPQSMKKVDERVRLLEKPEILEQMRKEKQLKKETKKALPTLIDPQVENGKILESTPENQANRKGNSANDELQSLNEQHKFNAPSQSVKSDGNSGHDKDDKETEKNVEGEQNKDKESKK